MFMYSIQIIELITCRRLSRSTSNLRLTTRTSVKNIVKTLIYILEDLVVRLERISTETLMLWAKLYSVSTTYLISLRCCNAVRYSNIRMSKSSKARHKNFQFQQDTLLKNFQFLLLYTYTLKFRSGHKTRQIKQVHYSCVSSYVSLPKP